MFISLCSLSFIRIFLYVVILLSDSTSHLPRISVRYKTLLVKPKSITVSSVKGKPEFYYDQIYGDKFRPRVPVH